MGEIGHEHPVRSWDISYIFCLWTPQNYLGSLFDMKMDTGLIQKTFSYLLKKELCKQTLFTKRSHLEFITFTLKYSGNICACLYLSYWLYLPNIEEILRLFPPPLLGPVCCI